MQIRTATSQDFDEIAQVVISAFAWPKERAKRLRPSMDWDVEGKINQWRALCLGGRIVSALRIDKRPIRIRGCRVLVGALGYVCTHPDYQGQGYASRLMTDSVQYMREQGFDLARLGGLVKFYSRFGWVRHPVREVEFQADLIAEDNLPGLHIRDYDFVQDYLKAVELHNRVHAQRTGVRVIEQEEVELHQRNYRANLDDPSLVAERDGRLVGYAWCGKGEDHFHIGDLGFDGGPEICVALIRQIAAKARQLGFERAAGTVPYDPPLVQALEQAGIAFILRERFGGEATNMLRIINGPQLFAKLAPWLSQNLDGSATPLRESGALTTGRFGCRWEGVIELEFQVDRVKLRIEGDSVSLCPDAEPDLTLNLTQTGLLRLITGLRSIEEIDRLEGLSLDAGSLLLLGSLFPRQYPMGGMA